MWVAVLARRSTGYPGTRSCGGGQREGAPLRVKLSITPPRSRGRYSCALRTVVEMWMCPRACCCVLTSCGEHWSHKRGVCCWQPAARGGAVAKGGRWLPDKSAVFNAEVKAWRMRMSEAELALLSNDCASDAPLVFMSCKTLLASRVLLARGVFCSGEA